MTIKDFIAAIESKKSPAPTEKLEAFEKAIACKLPPDYRRFLVACNGGYVGGALWFMGPTPEGKKADAGVHHVGGFRAQSYFSLTSNRKMYGERIPRELIWIMDDPFGNAICLGVLGKYRGKVFFWDHENEPDETTWDGSAGSAGNVELLANSFTDFVAGLIPLNDVE